MYVHVHIQKVINHAIKLLKTSFRYHRQMVYSCQKSTFLTKTKCCTPGSNKCNLCVKGILYSQTLMF